jgi:hypothetical protein
VRSPLRRGHASHNGRRRLDLTKQQWVVAFLIGTATVLAALFGWRAAAIGSTAAFDDRQSISETITMEQQRIDVGIRVDGDSREYARYLTDYGVAAELDNQAAALQAGGNAAAAESDRREARLLRATSTARAVDAGLFGRYSIQDDLRRPSASPRSFNVDQRTKALAVEISTGLGSPGKLDPGRWADQAERIRDRIQGLAAWSLALVGALLLFTVGQVNSDRRVLFYAFMGVGLVLLLVGGVGGFATDFNA